MNGDVEYLIEQAMLKATGADIHDVVNITAAYRLCAKLIDSCKYYKLTNKEKLAYGRLFYEFTIILSKYIDNKDSLRNLKDKYITKDLFKDIK